MPQTYRQVEEAAVARIEALDGSPYQPGPTHGARWKESETPLSVIADPSTLAHLSFNAWVQSAPNTRLERDLEDDGTVYVGARLVVAFAYRLRPHSQTADARKATDAAIDVTRALLAEWPEVIIALVDGLQPSLSLDGEWLLVTQSYTVWFDLSLEVP
jgi:hypothetical protein